MSQPAWSPTDDETADLLSLVRDEGHPSSDFEYAEFLAALRFTAEPREGLVDPNVVRELLRGVVAPRRIGAFYNAALRSGLIEWRGEWTISDDVTGHNAGRPCRTYWLTPPSDFGGTP